MVTRISSDVKQPLATIWCYPEKIINNLNSYVTIIIIIIQTTFLYCWMRIVCQMNFPGCNSNKLFETYGLFMHKYICFIFPTIIRLLLLFYYNGMPIAYSYLVWVWLVPNIPIFSPLATFPATKQNIEQHGIKEVHNNCWCLKGKCSLVFLLLVVLFYSNWYEW